MSLLRQLSVLAICQVLGDRADSLMGFVGERFHDHGTRLETALGKASERAWRCLEVALKGESWFASWFAAKDEQTLQQQVRLFLASIPAADLPGDAASFRKKAAAELDAARKAGLLPGGGVSAADLANDHARVFARYGDPQSLLRRDQELLAGVAGLLQQQGYTSLARYVSLCPAGGQPLLVQAVRYFFRREVESDDRLAAGLTLEKLDGLDAGLRAGFDDLHSALQTHGARLEQLLAATYQGMGEVSQKVSATMEEVSGARDDIQALRAQMQQQQAQLEERLRQVTALLEQAVKAGQPQRESAAPMAACGEGEAESPRREAGAGATESRSGFFALAAKLDQGSGDWAQVRRLLVQVQRITPEERRRRPELSRVMDEVTEAAQRVERTRRTILHLEQAQSGHDPIPTILPDDAPLLDALPAEPVKETRRASGRLISPIFQKAWQQQAAQAADEQTATGREPPVVEEPSQAAPDGPIPARRLLSPLFQKKPPRDTTGDRGKE